MKPIEIKMKKSLPVLLILILFSVSDAKYRDLFSDTWVGTDALGRNIPGCEQVGQPRRNKYVGIFYLLWLGQHGTSGPYDITKITSANPTNPAFGPIGAYHHWGQPELGYYLSNDKYVIGKHARLLADAGVDVLIIDATNHFTYQDNYMTLCSVFEKIRSKGENTPQIAFLCPFGDPSKEVESFYANLYSQNLFQDLWFYWKDKPLILADPEHVRDPNILNFFTFRKPIPTYFNKPSGPNQWGWSNVYPQPVFYGNDPNEIEQVTVSVAQNACDGKLAPMSHKDGAYGRSWHKGRKNLSPDSVMYGFNFQEQFDHALEVDPSFIFITEWNEWVAARFKKWAWYKAKKHSYYPDAMFVDQFNHEYSRDIEPMTGGHTDNYYYQMVANIRRYKGARKLKPASEKISIDIDGNFEDWNDVGPEFRDHVGDVEHRIEKGWGNSGMYINKTGRNDLVTMKVARDSRKIYFYAKTTEKLTNHNDANWMLLFIDIDQNHATGWQGYDFVVNLDVKDNTTSLSRLNEGLKPDGIAMISYAESNNELELAIPREALGLKPNCKIGFDFKWADNIQKLYDINEFFINGDVAPERRFNYRYNE